MDNENIISGYDIDINEIQDRLDLLEDTIFNIINEQEEQMLKIVSLLLLLLHGLYSKYLYTA